MKLHNVKIGNFPYVPLQVHLRCEKPGRMPKYKTSMIRGIIGRILKKQVCYDFQAACPTCEFRNSCVYSLLFESPDEAVKKLNIGGTVPHPYIIRYHDQHTSFHPGQTLVFDLLLLGPSNTDFAMYLFRVFEDFHLYPFGVDRAFFYLQAVYQLFDQTKEVVLKNSYVVKPEMTYFHAEEKH